MNIYIWGYLSRGESMYIKKVVFSLIIILLILGQVQRIDAASPLPKVYGKYATVIDAKTGEVIYSKQARGTWYPASLTKILTAMIFVDQVEKGTILTASKHAVEQDVSNSIFLLKVGEKMSREDALKALLIMSSNDVATMIAEHIAGSEAKFRVLMNQKAKEIGAKNSHFITPSGLHHPNHYTTTYDMALITREAFLNYPEVIKTMSLKSAVVQTSTRSVKLTNRSQFFSKPEVVGGKTGYTDAARNSLVEIVKKKDVTLIGVVMKSSKQDQYKDLTAMTNYSFKLLKSVVIIKEGQTINSVQLNGSSVPLIAKKSITYAAKLDSKIPFRMKETIFPQDALTSIVKGKQYGEVTVWKNGVKIGSTPLIAVRSIGKMASMY
jgi:D-alanyl-D-alanine carboxypeptidase